MSAAECFLDRILAAFMGVQSVTRLVKSLVDSVEVGTIQLGSQGFEDGFLRICERRIVDRRNPCRAETTKDVEKKPRNDITVSF